MNSYNNRSVLPRVDFKGAYEFIPGNDKKPFAFVQELFDLRAEIVAEIARTGIPNIVEKIIKLVLNSLYGKMAEAVGLRNDGKPPPTANPFYAAAITAWTRAKLLRAALHNPSGIVLFATDGIVSTVPLQGLPTVTEKVLGAWEFKEGESVAEAGIFVMAGIYSFFEKQSGKEKENTKTRGFKIETPRQFLMNELRTAWRKGLPVIDGPYTKYITLGAAMSSPENWKKAGCWCDGTRAMEIDSAGTKRRTQRGYRKRAETLIDTYAAENVFHTGEKKGQFDETLSRVYRPDWLDPDYGAEREDENEQRDIMLSRFDSGLDEDIKGGKL